MAKKFWIRNGKFVVDSQGRLILCEDCPCDAGQTPISACDDCPAGIPATFGVTYTRGASLNRDCTDCDTHFDQISNVPVVYQGTVSAFSNTYHAWRSALDFLNTTDCGGVFDDHEIWVLIRTVDAFSCEVKAIFKDNDDALDVSAGSATPYFWRAEGTISTLCNSDDFTLTQFDQTLNSSDSSLNCFTANFFDTITLVGVGAA